MRLDIFWCRPRRVCSCAFNARLKALMGLVMSSVWSAVLFSFFVLFFPATNANAVITKWLF